MGGWVRAFLHDGQRRLFGARGVIVRMDTCKAGPSKVLFYKGGVSNMEGESYRYSSGRPERHYTQCKLAILFVNARRETKSSQEPNYRPSTPNNTQFFIPSWKLTCKISGVEKLLCFLALPFPHL